MTSSVLLEIDTLLRRELQQWRWGAFLFHCTSESNGAYPYASGEVTRCTCVGHLLLGLCFVLSLVLRANAHIRCYFELEILLKFMLEAPFRLLLHEAGNSLTSTPAYVENSYRHVRTLIRRTTFMICSE
jgi:hypothetical protein